MYDPERDKQLEQKKTKLITSLFTDLFHLWETHEACIRISTYAVPVHIEDSPVCGVFFFLGSLCADHVSNLVYETCTLSSGLPNVWHCSRTLYLISISHENRNMQFRKDGRYTVSFSSRPCCQAPHNGRNSFFSRLSGAVRKLPRLENTGTVRDDKTSPGRCYFFVVVMLTVF